MTYFERIVPKLPQTGKGRDKKWSAVGEACGKNFYVGFYLIFI